MRIEKRIDEAFQNFDYKLPDDPELKMYDFYFMTVIAKNADLSREPEIQWVVQDAVETLVDDLYPHLNRAIKWSLTCEIRHIFDSNIFKPNSSEAQKVFEKYPEFIIEYYKALVDLRTGQQLPSYLANISNIAQFTDELADRMEQDPLVYKDNEKEREISNRAIKRVQRKLSISNLELANIYEDLYDSGAWGASFGGPKWAMIARGWAGLIKAESMSTLKKVVWMDHVYDLQHNTSTVFNKIKNYTKDGKYSWILTALNWKKNIKDPRQFYYKVSPQLKRLVAYISKNVYGKSIADFDGPEKKAYDKQFKTSQPSSPQGYDYGSDTSPTSSAFINVFKPDSNIQGAEYELNTDTMQKLKWNTNYRVGITAFLSNKIKTVDNLFGNHLVGPIIELSQVVNITGDVLFGSGSGQKPSIKKGKFIKRDSASVGEVQSILDSFDVLPSVSIDYQGTNVPSSQQTDEIPSWVLQASDGSQVYKATAFGQPEGFGLSITQLKDWGINTFIALTWKNNNVWISSAMSNLFNEKYSKIKWIFKLDLKNVYVHYNRDKDEAEIIGKSSGESSVTGYWKKGDLYNSTFNGTWNQGSFINSIFNGGTWVKGYFQSSSVFLAGTFKKHPATIFHGQKGGYPNSDGVDIVVENFNISKHDIYLKEDSIQTSLRTRSGWV